ncbi:hypothetical protein Xcel_2342 [Xylanimonas cellulosilytica DSM 15894]|uniref:Uncharacterized protein n=1 Tax=Xylanimonas cellulosilytica (strain DSM 15894 / JCM 12276 / CECT 5975 / KCTC 9989 / LMG 20990 / NBRC 107835 / XIL07) TaxID=446471 RepID=D1BVN9_XYLCX|nr:hypothetical protein [Xylanimonas cellulosilytica]ACZ31358.1 hypothetical protein Xcel_2342 [Xylanimonas cellulosilytica DSM 15894]
MKHLTPDPGTLRRASITVREDSTLDVRLDGHPFDGASEWTPVGPPAIGMVLDKLRTVTGERTRVDIRLADGTQDVEFLVPDQSPEPPAPSAPNQPTTTVRHTRGGTVFGVSQGGFRPGEKVSIAVVVSTSDADIDGVANLRLPPGLLAGRPFTMLLLGHKSGSVVIHDPHDAARSAA